MILIHYCREQENIADLGFKAIFGQDFLYKKQGLMGLQENEETAKPLKRPEKKVKFSEIADKQKDMPF